MFSKGKSNIELKEILSKVSEFDILKHYFHILKLPCLINSPIRRDNNPSFGLYFKDNRIFFHDFSTREKGGLFDLLGIVWNISFSEVLERIYNDIPHFNSLSSNRVNNINKKTESITLNEPSKIEAKEREWQNYDLEYWKEYGITLDWLKFANIYPISHKIIIKGGVKYTFKADKYAYAYVEKKDHKVTLKIYQPFNKNGYKWSNNHDKSVISLWTKMPKKCQLICICSSVKDALCLWANTGIPSIAIQGEGYDISETAINELKRRFTNIFICLDNDKTGLIDAEKLASKTKFINIVLPQFKEGKDISDLYKAMKDKKEFKKLILELFKNGQKRTLSGG